MLTIKNLRKKLDIIKWEDFYDDLNPGQNVTYLNHTFLVEKVRHCQGFDEKFLGFNLFVFKEITLKSGEVEIEVHLKRDAIDKRIKLK